MCSPQQPRSFGGPGAECRGAKISRTFNISVWKFESQKRHLEQLEPKVEKRKIIPQLGI